MKLARLLAVTLALMAVAPAHADSPAPAIVSPGAAAPRFPCAQNCPPGDQKCLQACPKSGASGNGQPANFACLNQCTQAGYAFAYCKEYCSR
jgi:hypothetical protein